MKKILWKTHTAGEELFYCVKPTFSPTELLSLL